MSFTLSNVFNWIKRQPPAPVAPPTPPAPTILQLPNLYDAKESDIAEMIKAALAKGETLQGSSALHDVCKKGWLDTAKLLLDSGADVNAASQRNNDKTPFMEAASSANPDLLEELLKRGANAQAVDRHGNNAFTGFFYDSYYNSPIKGQEAEERDRRAFKILLDQNLAMEPVLAHSIYLHRRHLASFVPEVEKALTFEKAVKDQDYATVYQMMQDGIKPDVGADFSGQAALNIAAGKNDLKMMGMLMAAGADIKRFSGGSFDALHAAAITGSRDAFVKIVGAGVNTDGDIYAYDRYEDTTIVEVAAMCKADPGMKDFVEKTLARKAEVIAEYQATEQKFLHPYEDIKLETDHRVAVHKPLHFRPRI